MRHQSMKLKWMCLLFLSLLLSPPLLWGQNHSIKGQIVDAKSNEPLIGVNITVEGNFEWNHFRCGWSFYINGDSRCCAKDFLYRI